MSETPALAWKADLFGRSLLGFIGGAFSAGLLGGFGMWGLSLFSEDQGPSLSGAFDALFMMLFTGGAMGMGLALPWALLAGWPIHALLMWRKLTGLLIYGLCGAVLAVFAFFAQLGLDMFVPNTLASMASFVALLAATGFLGASIFWLIRRPDRPAQPKVFETMPT